MNPKVSIIVPVYNVEKYLDRCMNSLLNQTLQEIEIILVDDGSPDNCPKKCDEYARIDLRVKVIHKENAGLGLARNTGMEAASGEYIAFVDSDDFVELNAFDDMYNASLKNNAEMCMAGYYKYNTNCQLKQKISIFQQYEIFSAEQVNEIAYKMVGAPPEHISDEYYGMSVWKNLYSLKFLREIRVNFNSEREYVSEDAVFHLNAVPKMFTIVTLPNSYYCYCDNNDTTLTSTFKESKFKQYKKLYLKELKIIKQNANSESELGKLCVARMFLGNIRNHMKQLVNSPNSLLVKYKKAKIICNDEILQDVLIWYPYKKNPIAQKIFSFLLKHKLASLCLVFAKLKTIYNK